jgi:hypothetical protein
MYENAQGWSSLCQYALSDACADYPSLNTNADCGFMVLDREFTQESFNRAMTDFDDDDYDLFRADALEADGDSFGRVLELLEPFACFALSDRLLLLAREESSLDSFLASRAVEVAESLQKESKRESRLKLWQQLGPERGPEVCVVESCDRLRIGLAVKCFLHQVGDCEDAMHW